MPSVSVDRDGSVYGTVHQSWWTTARVVIAASRPFGWIIYSTFALAGLLVAGGHPSVLCLVQLALLTVPACLVVFGVNDVYDFDSDVVNPRKGSIEGIRLGAANHRAVKNAAAAAAGVMIAVSLLTRSATNFMGTLCLLIFAWAYSAPPARLKERPIIDSLANAAMILGAFLIGFSYGLPFTRMYSKWYVMALAGGGIHAFTTILDYTPDRQAGYRTFATVCGKRAAAFFALVTMLCFVAILDAATFSRLFLASSAVLYLVTFVCPSETLARRLFYVGYVEFAAMTVGLALAVFRT